jgi:hypothetical protein
MPRYAVLRSLDARSLPIGIAVERDGYVHIDALDEYGLPPRIDEEYRVLGRDLSEVRYTPGDPGYFDQLLVELSRVVSVGEQGSVPDSDSATLDELLETHVLAPRRVSVRGTYVGALTAGVGGFRQRGDSFVYVSSVNPGQLPLHEDVEGMSDVVVGHGHSYRLAA